MTDIFLFKSCNLFYTICLFVLMESENPVVYAELPGAHHNFDLFHSIRSVAVIEGVEAFTAWVLADR